MAPQAIPQKLYYRAAEVAEIVGVKTHILRYWEAEFGFAGPQKEGEGERLYTQRDLERALAIRKLLQEDRYPVAATKRKLREDWGRVKEADARETEARPADLREERRRLLRRLHIEAEELAKFLGRQ